MKLTKIASIFLCLLLFNYSAAQKLDVFSAENFPNNKAWTHLDFKNDPQDFQFAIVSDRTGGHRPGIFGKAVEKLNMLMPEFVMSVGDLIEGYTKDSMEVNRQWDEFNQIVAPLKMPFFYLPGNHDFSNDMMRNQWLEKYGRDYYYFKYKNVLFITMNTNDEDETMFGQEQIDYVKQVLEENRDVRWTMLFMHHPAWAYTDYNGDQNFTEIENALVGRDYTVFAGHTHRYMHSIRQNKNYYVLATTGGGSSLVGPSFGRFDHVTWVTITDEGPEILNLKLDGMIKHNVANEANAALAKSLMASTKIKSQIVIAEQTGKQGIKAFNFANVYKGGAAVLKVENTADKPLHFKGRFYHHHQVSPDVLQIDTLIQAKSSLLQKIEIRAEKPFPYEDIEPLELAWTMGYEKELLEPTFELEGTYLLEINADVNHLEITDQNIFTETLEVSLDNPFNNLVAHYTLDGSVPTTASPQLKQKIKLTESTGLKVKLFDDKGNGSNIFSKKFEKVEPREAVKVKSGKKGLKYQYFEGEFQDLPTFSQMKPTKTGVTENFDIEALSGEREDHYAFTFEGYIEVPTTGLYTFYLYSDDGSRLFISKEEVVDNGGSHSAKRAKGMIALEKGKHSLKIEYFEDFLGETLSLGWKTPEMDNREAIPPNVLSHK